MNKTARLFAITLGLTLSATACSGRDLRSQVGLSTAMAPSRQDVRARLGAHREQQIARLEAYAHAGRFPENETAAPQLHIFRDAAGRLCAVANLIHQDGRDDLVEATVLRRNDLAIVDVHDGPILDWIAQSGLTQEELVAIQFPAQQVEQAPLAPPPQLVAKAGPMPSDPPRARSEGSPATASPRLTGEQMATLVRKHLADVEAQLRADGARSLDVAVERWLATHASPDGTRAS